MKVIHVARKPLEGTVSDSVLEHGTGALHIDASRVSYKGESDMTPSVGKGEPGQLNPGCGTSLPQHKDNWGTWTVNRSGRWPSNLILQHLPECEHVGTHQVASDGHYPAARPSGSKVSGPSGHKGQEGLQEAFTKGETVDTWACAPGCPVAALDADSGITTNTSHYSYKRSGAGFIGTIASQPERDRWVTETGGASRFFKQVKR